MPHDYSERERGEPGHVDWQGDVAVFQIVLILPMLPKEEARENLRSIGESMKWLSEPMRFFMHGNPGKALMKYWSRFCSPF
jgi:hypothetical protein